MKKIILFLGLCFLLGQFTFLSFCKIIDNTASQTEILQNKIKATLDSVIANTHVLGLTAGVWAPNDGIDLVYSSDIQQQRFNCNNMGVGSPLNYGLGIYESNGFYGHDSQLPGFTSLMIYSPERNCTTSVWYNCQLDNSLPLYLVWLIPKIIYPDIEINK